MSNVREAGRFIVSKTPFKKVITSTVDTPKRDTKVQAGNTDRPKRAVQSIVRWFQRQGTRKTCSVLGAKDVGVAEMSLLRLVACRKYPDTELHFMGVAEYADSGEHAHFCVFKIIEDAPHPLDPEEEAELVDELNLYLSAWYMRKNKEITPFRFLKQKRVLDVLADRTYWKIVYRVPMIRYLDDGRFRRAPSGMQHYAVAYSLKSLMRPDQAKFFRGSIGVGHALKAAKKTEDVRVKEKTIVNMIYCTYRMDLISYLAYEAEKQLRYRKPEEISAYIRYGKLFVSTQDVEGVGNIRLVNDQYLLIGLELLRRYLRDFDGASTLRRAVNKVCNAMCLHLRQDTNEGLEDTARKLRGHIEHKAMMKRQRKLRKRKVI